LRPGPVRLGLAGAGGWGRAFIRTIADLPDEIQLAGLASANPASRDLIEPADALHETWPAMLAAGGLDGVIVATPPATHAEIAEAALEHGLAILVEKPLTLDLDQAMALRDRAQAAGAVAHVDHIDLFNPAWVAVRRRIGNIGQIRDLEGACTNRGPLRPDTSGRWDYGPHPLAVSIDLVGREPDQVAAQRIAREDEAELIEARLSWDAGPTAVLVFGNAAGEKRRAMTVRSVTETFTYNDLAADKARLDGAALDYGPQTPLAVLLTRFAAAIRRGKPDASDLDLAVGVVRTLFRIDEALRARPT
jgi:predicted dehydrogenase